MSTQCVAEYVNFTRLWENFILKGREDFFNKKSNLQIFVCICEFVKVLGYVHEK